MGLVIIMIGRTHTGELGFGIMEMVNHEGHFQWLSLVFCLLCLSVFARMRGYPVIWLMLDKREPGHH